MLGLAFVSFRFVSCRTLRKVQGLSQDKLVSDRDISASLLTLFQALFRSELSKHREVLGFLTVSSQTVYRSPAPEDGHCDPSRVMLDTLGFSIHRAPSSLQAAGTGVFVDVGVVPKGATVAMYPGTVYQTHEPIFFQSIGNPFVFRCIDGVLIDGNDRGISKVVFRSCSGRDRLGPFKLSDVSWLSASPGNPLAVGQYVNNCSNEKAANVCYQEFDVPDSFPLELRQYLPNVNYRQDIHRPLRCVVLVALREIHAGEELFSNYFTVVH
ncbi:SETD9 protein, partial [Amia calva]|nr:SETD9 protein [Amia calva]